MERHARREIQADQDPDVGEPNVEDTVAILRGLTDPNVKLSMGSTAEIVAERFGTGEGGGWQGPWRLLHGLAAIGSPALRTAAMQAVKDAGRALTLNRDVYESGVGVALGTVAEKGVDAEVIDLRTLRPMDTETVVASVKKTGRCVVVHEATRTCGFGAELVSLVQEHCFYHLEAPIERVTGWDTPYPHALEWAYFPGPKRMKKALEKVMAV